MSQPKTVRSRAAKRLRTRRRWVGLGATALVLAAVGGWLNLRPRALPVRTTPVVTTYLSQQSIVLHSTGYVVAQRKAAIASKASGRLAWVGVVPGTRVKAGEVIARLEAHDVTTALDTALAGERSARATLDQARAEAREAAVALSRTQELVAQKRQSRSSLEPAKARVERAAAGVVSGSTGLVAAETSARNAQLAVEYTLIRAPFDGVILSNSAAVGDMVTPFSSTASSRGAVVNMADASSLEVETDVSDASVSKIKVGQPAEITLDAVPETRFRGSVSRIAPAGTGATPTLVAKVRFDALDPRVLPQMSAKVSFLSGPVTAELQQPLIAVNSEALAQRGGKTVVYVIRDSKAVEVPVTPGRALADLTVIAGDVKAGESAVLWPATELKGGALVEQVTR